jgi:DNA-directed RNA polymerase subunit RPC12/RpoP
VELEERTIESLPARCENCGAALTEAEKQRILDQGEAIALCSTCAAEVAPAAEGEEEDAAPY